MLVEVFGGGKVVRIVSGTCFAEERLKNAGAGLWGVVRRVTWRDI